MIEVPLYAFKQRKLLSILEGSNHPTKLYSTVSQLTHPKQNTMQNPLKELPHVMQGLTPTFINSIDTESQFRCSQPVQLLLSYRSLGSSLPPPFLHSPPLNFALTPGHSISLKVFQLSPSPRKSEAHQMPAPQPITFVKRNSSSSANLISKEPHLLIRTVLNNPTQSISRPPAKKKKTKKNKRREKEERKKKRSRGPEEERRHLLHNAVQESKRTHLNVPVSPSRDDACLPACLPA